MAKQVTIELPHSCHTESCLKLCDEPKKCDKQKESNSLDSGSGLTKCDKLANLLKCYLHRNDSDQSLAQAEDNFIDTFGGSSIPQLREPLSSTNHGFEKMANKMHLNTCELIQLFYTQGPHTRVSSAWIRGHFAHDYVFNLSTIKNTLPELYRKLPANYREDHWCAKCKPNKNGNIKLEFGY